MISRLDDAVQEDPLSSIYRRSSAGNAAGDSVPFFHQGRYHLFHLSVPIDSLGQQYPYRCTTQQSHAVSEDLVTWKEEQTALVPGESYDADGCWTGSIVEDAGTYYLFYTGHTAGAHNPQTICLATGTDGTSFTKVADNPLLSPDPAVFERIDFRDPYVFRNDEDGKWWMLIAARLAEGPEGLRGTIALSTSEDLLHWSEPQPFYSPSSTFCPECPEMFKLGDWWYLVYSHFSESMRTTYRVSRTPEGPWRTPARPGLDGRRFYAAKSMPTADPNRRLMWGSIYERIGLDDSSDWTYAGDFGVPRELRSNADGSLSVSIPAEVQAAFGAVDPLTLQPDLGHWSSTPTTASAVADLAVATAALPTETGPVVLRATLRPHELVGPFGLYLFPSEDLSSTHAVTFDPQGQRVTISLLPQSLDPFWESLTSRDVPPPQIDGPHVASRPVQLTAGESVEISVVIEGSLVEVFVAGQVAMSYRIYDRRGGRVGVFAQDTVLTVERFEVAS